LTSNTREPFWFDEDLYRRQVPTLKVHPMVLGQGGDDLFAAGVADMVLKAPPAVINALQKRLDHGVFGYETAPDSTPHSTRSIML